MEILIFDTNGKLIEKRKLKQVIENKKRKRGITMKKKVTIASLTVIAIVIIVLAIQVFALDQIVNIIEWIVAVALVVLGISGYMYASMYLSDDKSGK